MDEKGRYVWERRPLDPTKIDYHSSTNNYRSSVRAGVYPEGTTKEQVLAKVRGTFGGRFNSFGDGKFNYTAWMD